MKKMCKEFLLHKIAKLDNGNKFDKNKMTHNNPCYNFVSRTATNNGISDYVDDNGTEPYPAGTITLAFGGSIGSTFVQPKPYYTGQNVGVITLPDNVSEEAKVYFAISLEKMCKCKYVAFADEINKHFKTDLTVVLPVIENANPNHEYTVDDIDWQYMRDRITELERDRITELERDRITELEGYLQATGLNDYELKKADVRYGKFVIGEIFNSQNGDNNLRKADVNGKGVHIVTAGVKNNGIIGLSDKGAKVINANTITVDMFGNVYFRDFAYKMTRNVFSLELKEGALSEGAGLYICSELKQLAELFDYDNSCSFNKIKSLSIELPIKSDGTPDFDYMERYIRAIEKVVISDVMKYKDKVIETTKKVVES